MDMEQELYTMDTHYRDQTDGEALTRKPALAGLDVVGRMKTLDLEDPTSNFACVAEPLRNTCQQDPKGPVVTYIYIYIYIYPPAPDLQGHKAAWLGNGSVIINSEIILSQISGWCRQICRNRSAIYD